MEKGIQIPACTMEKERHTQCLKTYNRRWLKYKIFPARSCRDSINKSGGQPFPLQGEGLRGVGRVVLSCGVLVWGLNHNTWRWPGVMRSSWTFLPWARFTAGTLQLRDAYLALPRMGCKPQGHDNWGCRYQWSTSWSSLHRHMDISSEVR